MKVYVAASWRTPQQPEVVQAIRDAGHDVYDFRHEGFGWKELDPNWEQWDLATYLKHLHTSARALEGFTRDMDALSAADACVLVLPSGRSAHLEFGYAIGRGKLTIVLFLETPVVPDLMYLAAHYRAVTIQQAVRHLRYAKRPWGQHG